jgi:hypothetical protein
LARNFRSLGDEMVEHYTDDWKTYINETVQELRKEVLMGNGRLPLTQRVSSLENSVKALVDNEARRSQKLDRIQVGVWVGVALMIVTILMRHLH